MIQLRMILLHVLFTSLVIGTTFATANNYCTTPYGKQGECISIKECSDLFNVLPSCRTNQTARRIIQEHQCGIKNSLPFVCCATNKTSSQAEFISQNIVTEDLPDRSICGLETPGIDRIVGGKITKLEEFPWMAAIEYRYNATEQYAGINCGGTIINNRYVLTAAHCLRTLRIVAFRVRLGEWDISSDLDCDDVDNAHCSDPVVEIAIAKRIMHPAYSVRAKHNDIGLIKLQENIAYTDYIRPVCLPLDDIPIPDFETQMTVVGWGRTENGTTSNLKLKVKVPLKVNAYCQNVLKNALGLNQLCAGGESGKDSCGGDSGGPLMVSLNEVNEQKQWYLHGIVSYGHDCGRTGYPAVYTRVDQYIEWIKEAMRTN